jgi:hypothetical protein
MLVRLSSWEASSCGQNSHKEINTRDTRFYPMVRPSNTCLLPRCGVPMDEGCTQPLSSDPMINLNTTIFLPYIFSRLWGISTSWSLSPLQQRSQWNHKSKVGEQHTHAHKPRLELKMKHKEFTTRTELKSVTQSIKSAETECGRLRMLSECLGGSSMR